MIRLTTPTHRFRFPFELDSEVAKIIITYTQNRRVILEKEFVEFPGGGNTIEYTLTQSETKSFVTGAKTEVQGSALFANGKAVKSAVYELKIKGSLRPDIINTDAPETETEFSIVEGEPCERGCFCDMDMEFDMDMELGIKGDPGQDGITPHIGDNRHWFIGDVDTGVLAEGVSGVYVGGGDMPEGYNVQIDPEGDAVDEPNIVMELNSPEDLETFINSSANIARVGDLTISQAISIPTAKKCEHKRIIGGTIRLSSDMFAWTNPGTPTNIPHFDSVVFFGNGHNIAPQGAYATNGHFSNCSFIDCGLMKNGSFAQSQRFINCRIAMAASHPFIHAACVYDVRFIAIQAESDNKSPIIHATNTNTIYSSVADSGFTDCLMEGQITEIVRMNEGSLYVKNCMTIQNVQFAIIEAPIHETNPLLKLICNGSSFITKNDTDYVFEINPGFLNSTRTMAELTFNSVSVGHLISDNDFRFYHAENNRVSDNGKIFPSEEPAKIGALKTSVVDFTTVGHCIVKKFPCLISFNSTDGGVHTNLYFVSMVEKHPSVICLSDPTKTPTIVYDSDNGYADITLHANRYGYGQSAAVLLDGQSNNLIRTNFWRATDGYDA